MRQSGSDKARTTGSEREIGHRCAREINVAWCVDQVERICPVVLRVSHARCVQLDGDAAFSLEVHAIQELFHHLSLINRPGLNQQLHAAGGSALNVECCSSECQASRPTR